MNSLQGTRASEEQLCCACVGTNVALHATAIQYNTYSTNSASLAVDGSFATPSCTLFVHNGTQSWWAVDLGNQRHVNVVQVAGNVLPLER